MVEPARAKIILFEREVIVATSKEGKQFVAKISRYGNV